MKNFISPQSKNDLLKIGLYQIISGFFGLSIFLWSVLGAKTPTAPVIVLTLIALLFFLSYIAINMNVQSEVVAIDFNLIAIIIFLWLDKINKRTKAE
jgi:hypothetical protein